MSINSRRGTNFLFPHCMKQKKRCSMLVITNFPIPGLLEELRWQNDGKRVHVRMGIFSMGQNGPSWVNPQQMNFIIN